MGHRIRYARIGNAEPMYMLEPEHEPDNWVSCGSVDEVSKALPMYTKKLIRLACREAREKGVSDFLLWPREADK